MAMSVALSIGSGPVIAGARVSLLAAITNGGSTAVAVTGIQLVATPAGASVDIGAVNLGPNVSSSVVGSGTLYFPLSCAFYPPQKQGVTAAVGGQHRLYAVCSFDDGTVAVSPMLSVVVNHPTNLADAVAGQTRFDVGSNSGLVALVSPN